MKKIINQVFQWHTTNWKSGPIGKLKIVSIGTFVVLVILSDILGKPSEGFERMKEVGTTSIEMNSGVVVVNKKINSKGSANTLADELSERLYRLAKNNQDAKKIVFILEMDKSGVSDQYGNPIEADVNMGTMEFEESSIVEARKYKDSYTYKRAGTRDAIHIELKAMKGGYLLGE